MKSKSIHDVNRSIPCVATTILRNISRKSMSRTTRQRGKYYYRGKTHDSLRVIFDINEKTIQYIRELKTSYGKRHESLTYHYRDGIVVKEFHERSSYDPKWNSVTYPFVLDEAEHFTQSLVLDQYFPELEDFVKMDEMKKEFQQDTIDWDKELYIKKREREKASAKKWMEKTGRTLPDLLWNRKSKAKRSSS